MNEWVCVWGGGGGCGGVLSTFGQFNQCGGGGAVHFWPIQSVGVGGGGAVHFRPIQPVGVGGGGLSNFG